jgi:hypothetical protein
MSWFLEREEKFNFIFIVFSIITICWLIMLPITNLCQHANANSVSIQTTDTDFVYGSFENVKINGTGKDANLRLNVYKGWIKKVITDTPKQKNYYDMANIHNTDKNILLSSTGEIFIYDHSNNSWFSKNRYGPFNENYNFAVSPIFNTKCMLLYGGHAGIWSSSNTYLYNLTLNYWYNPQPDLQLGVRSYHSLAPIYGTDKVLMFGGGADQWSSDNSTCIYDYSDNTWLNMRPRNSPSKRIKQALAPISGTDKILLFGGERVYNITVFNSSSNSTEIHVIRYTLNDTWIYDLSDNYWTNVTPELGPEPRKDHELESVGKLQNIILFGGERNNKKFKDTWSYEFKANKWVKINTKNKPSIKCSYKMTSIFGTDKVVLYTGINSKWRDNSGWSDETWIYKHYFDTINGTYTSQPLDMGKNATFQALKWCAILPENTMIQFQLKTAPTEQDLDAKGFFGPNGGLSKYYSTSPSKIWSGHDGDRWLQYRIFFNTTNKNEYATLKELSISYNLHPEVTILMPKDNQKLSDNTPKFKWEISDDSLAQRAFQILIDDNITFLEPDFDTGIQVSSLNEWNFPFNTRYNLLTDGGWYCKIRVQDIKGAWGSYSNTIKFIIDTVPPESKIITPENNGIYRAINIISVSGDNIYNGTEVSMVEIQIQRLSDNSIWNENTWSNKNVWLKTIFNNDWVYDPINIDWDYNIKYKIKSRAKDCSGNIELLPDEVNFYIDNNDPYTEIRYPNKYWLNELVTINGTANDHGSDIDHVRIQIKDIQTNTYWTGTTWDTDMVWIDADGAENWSYNAELVSWEAGKIYNVRCRAVDKLGNQEFPGDSFNFSFDFKKPRTKSFSINEGAKYTRFREIHLKLKAEDRLSGVKNMCFSNDNNKWSSWMDFNEDLSLILPEIDGKYIFYSKIRDFALNIGKVENDSIILDTRPPHKLSISIENQTESGESIKIILKLNATDSLSEVSKMSFNLDDTIWSPWKDFETKWNFSLPNETGNHTIYFRVMDHAGNVADPVSRSFVLETIDDTLLSKDETEFDFIPDNKYEEDVPSISITWIFSTFILIIMSTIIIFHLYIKNKTNRKYKKRTVKKPNYMKHSNIPDKIVNSQILLDNDNNTQKDDELCDDHQRKMMEQR